MAITVGDSLFYNRKMPSIDLKYGPYTSIDDAYSQLYEMNVICIGLTVGIEDTYSGAIEEYWFKEGVGKSHLVKKRSSSTEVDLTNYYDKAAIDEKYDSMQTMINEMSATIEELTYSAPSISSFSATPSFGVKEVGSSITVSAASVTITKGSKDLTSLSVLSGTTELASITSDIVEGANSLSFSLSVSSSLVGSTTLTASLTDGKSTVTKTGTYTFVYPIYYGVLDSVSSVDSTSVAALTKLVQSKGSKTLSFALSNKVAIFAYPIDYGTLSSIKDQNSFTVTSTFTASAVTINGISYSVYALTSPSNVGTFSYTFSF